AGTQFDFGDFSDFFSTFFSGADTSDIFEFGHDGIPRTAQAGGFGTRTQPQRGSDLEQTLDITLEEAFNGTSRSLRLQIPETQTTRQIKVKIPKGVTNGSRIRLAGQGRPGPFGGPAGDLYLVTKIAPHHFFQVSEHDLSCEVPVPDYDALLGTGLEMPTLEGKVNLKIPAGTQAGTILKLKNQGLPFSGNKKRGDLLVRVKIIIPKNLSAEEKKLIEEFKKSRGNKDAK
ncbi:MAG: DnaJ C-terminal domain-containing protein, partial [Planctomycetota bacterium]